MTEREKVYDDEIEIEIDFRMNVCRSPPMRSMVFEESWWHFGQWHCASRGTKPFVQGITKPEAVTLSPPPDGPHSQETTLCIRKQKVFQRH